MCAVFVQFCLLEENNVGGACDVRDVIQYPSLPRRRLGAGGGVGGESCDIVGGDSWCGYGCVWFS